MDDLTISVVATIVACLAAGWVCFPWIAYAVNVPAFTNQIEKLAMAGNLDRAAKLCKAAPRVPFCAATLAALETGGTDAETLRQRFRETLTARVVAMSASWIVVGAAIAGVATAIAFATSGALPVIGAICGIAALMLVNAYLQARKLAAAAVTEGERVVKAIVASRGQ
ncbi:MAG TPA: hypothetical protein VL463_12215 [Kofleriaceae bacterium]|nr:hypothetical protein [Kofleriaceae bacterium]